MKIAIMILMMSCVLQANFLDQHSQGWWWYQDPVVPVEEDDKFEQQSAATTSSKPMTDRQKQEAYGKEMENRLATAWLNPTAENVANYQRMQFDMMERSSNFANVWMGNVFRHPELDHTLKSPVNQKATHIKADLDKEAKLKTIKELSSDFGLFFFFGGDCKYCHEFAPVVKAFGDKHGWQVMAISVDGKMLETFPDAQLDNGLFEDWKLTALPVVIAVNPQTGEAIPIAQGMVALSEMEDRIMLLNEQREAQS